MRSTKRYNEYKEESLDMIITKIKRGTIKCGSLAGLVKVNDKPMKGKEFFTDGQSEDQDGSAQQGQ